MMSARIASTKGHWTVISVDAEIAADPEDPVDMGIGDEFKVS
jgi:hypothetical protein